MTDQILHMISEYYKIHEDGVLRILTLTITPTFLKIENESDGFKIVIHGNKNLIKIGYRERYGYAKITKIKYDYIDILYEVLSLDNTYRYFYPSILEEETYRNLHIHNRNKSIDSILTN